MKTKLIIALFAIVTVAACKKEKVVNGTNGLTIHSGSATPTMDMGSVGDYFMDTVSNVFWGPKNSTNWGNGLDMVGNRLLSGNTPPDLSQGKTGDFYLNTTTNIMYGPKTDVGWTAQASLVGPKGIDANVIYTAWISSPTTSAHDTTVDGTAMKILYLYPKSLTNSILNEGIMLTYFRIGSIGPFCLPYIADAGGATNQINAMYGLNIVGVYRHTFNSNRFNSGVAASYTGEPVMVGLPKALEYRLIFVPGITKEGAMPLPVAGNQSTNSNKWITLPGMDNPVNLSSMPYEDVCKLLNIKP